jgi:hypothetical protein
MSDAHILNPNVDITPIDSDGAISGFEVSTVVKGRGRLRHIVSASDANSPAFGVLKQLLQGEAGEVSSAAWQQLFRLGVVVTPEEVASPVRFACRLEELREADLPARLCPPQPSSLVVNPTLQRVGFDELVRPMPKIGHIWEPAEQLVMVRDPRTEIDYPYWPDDELLRLVERLRPGHAPPSDLSAEVARRLFLAGILIDDRAERFEELIAAARARYAASGYVVLPKLFRPTHIAAMREYYRRVLEEGFVYFRDRQVPLRFADHSEPLMVYYHVQLCRLFEAIAGEPIMCSYPYFAAYRTGAVLEKHTDREQCEITASLLIDQLPHPEDVSDWPLFVEIPATGEQIPMHMGIGDGSLYKGRELPHYRLPYEGELTTCHFYHYVKADFDGSLS